MTPYGKQKPTPEEKDKEKAQNDKKRQKREDQVRSEKDIGLIQLYPTEDKSLADKYKKFMKTAIES